MEAGNLKPENELQHQGTLSNAGVRMVRLDFPERAEALHYTQERFVYWSPAALFLYGGFRVDMLADFNQTCGVDLSYYHHRFDSAIFDGLHSRDGNRDWNHVLWAVDKEHWPGLLDHLCSLTLMNRQSTSVVKYAMQEIHVTDPIATGKVLSASSLPVMPVHFFGVKTNHWTAAIDLETRSHLLQLPALRFFDPDPGCKMYADMLYDKQQLDLSELDTNQ